MAHQDAYIEAEDADTADGSRSQSQRTAEEHKKDEEQETKLEEWSKWLQRTTHQVEDMCCKLGLEDWVSLQRKRKWRLAGHTARRDDGRWSTTILHWKPDGERKQGHPRKRWADQLNAYFLQYDCETDFWLIAAQEREEWENMTNNFIKI